MKMNRKERIKLWAEKLTEEQAKSALCLLVDGAVDSEDINFWDDSIAPYWGATGDPLIEGQDCWPEEE